MKQDLPPQKTFAGGHATMADVAAMAGVSLKSVSRVVNNEPFVTAKLREKVQMAIAALDYVPDSAARSLAGARNLTIGVLFDNPSPNYTMKVVAGAYAACTQRQYHLRIDNIDSTASPVELGRQLDLILRHSRVDGLVLTPPITDSAQVLDFLEARGISYSRIAPMLDPERSARVWIDDVAAGAAIADHFWSYGHRRYAIVNGPARHGAAILRRQGFINRLRELDPTILVSEADGAFLFEAGIAAGRSLLAARRYPTAIFAANDDSAAGVMVACRQFALEVPRDVSICGFDDGWVAKSVWPYLTTINQPIEAMAHAATGFLLDREKAAAKTSLQLDFALIERASVANPP